MEKIENKKRKTNPVVLFSKKIEKQKTNFKVQSKKIEKEEKIEKSLIENFINLLMINGEKYKAFKLFSLCLNYLRKKIKIHDKKNLSLAIYILFKAVDNVKPVLEVRKKKVGGSTYIVPGILSKKRQQTFAVKWIIESAENRKKKSNACFAECLAQELVDAYKKQGQAIQKRDQLNKLAAANRVYIRYRWW